MKLCYNQSVFEIRKDKEKPMDQKKELFETMPVPKALAKLAIPTIISQLISMIYNLADTFFIGLTNDPYKVAASTLAFVLFFVLCALANLFGVGGGTLISRLLGQGKVEEVKSVSSFSFYGTIGITLLYSIGCFVFREKLLYAVGASPNTYAYAESYAIWVVVVGGIPSSVSMALSHFLRSEGFAKQASFGLGLGGVINIVLDPVFMFLLFPGREVFGAAVATCLANVISMLYFFIVISRLKGKTVLSLSPKFFFHGFSYLSQIFAVGIPSALAAFLASLSNLFLNQLASGYGDIELAALGIVKKIDMLPLNTGMGLCQGMIPLVAYNYASGDRDRMKKVISACRFAGLTFAGLCVLLFEIFSRQIVTIFIQDGATVAFGIVFLRICCLATPLMFFNLLSTFALQGMGKGPESLILSVCRQGLVNIPLLFLMNSLFGLYGVLFTQLLADAITMILATLLTRRVYRSLGAE